MLFSNNCSVIGGRVSQQIFSSTNWEIQKKKKHNNGIPFFKIPPIFSNFPSYPKGITHWVSQEKKIRVVLYSLNG